MAAEWLADGGPVFVLRDEDGHPTVLSAVSTHRPGGIGTLVAWCASSAPFEDPHFGSRFDLDGAWVSGPAPTGLERYRTEVTAGGVTVEQPMPGPPRGVSAIPPAGANCPSDGEPSEGRSWPPGSVRHEPDRLRPLSLVVSFSTGDLEPTSARIVHERGELPLVCTAAECWPISTAAEATVDHTSPEGPILVRATGGTVVEVLLLAG